MPINPINYPNKLDINTAPSDPFIEAQHVDLAYNEDNVNKVMANDVNVLIDICMTLEKILGVLPYIDPNYKNGEVDFTSIKARLDGISSNLVGHVHSGAAGSPAKVNRDHIDITTGTKRISADYLPMSLTDTTKIKSAIDGKVPSSDVVTTPTPNKIMKLDGASQFPGSVIAAHEIPYLQMLLSN